MTTADTLNQILDLLRLSNPKPEREFRFYSSERKEAEWDSVVANGFDDWVYRPTSLDSFARVLRAMPEAVQERFDLLVAEVTSGSSIEQWGFRPRVRPTAALLADPRTLWPLLHRAAFPDGVVNK